MPGGKVGGHTFPCCPSHSRHSVSRKKKLYSVSFHRSLVLRMAWHTPQSHAFQLFDLFSPLSNVPTPTADALVFGPIGLLVVYGMARGGTAVLNELRNVIFAKVWAVAWVGCTPCVNR